MSPHPLSKRKTNGLANNKIKSVIGGPGWVESWASLKNTVAEKLSLWAFS
jgi:hypothetical protein